jgi:DNA-binding transcriptional regulator PaaX
MVARLPIPASEITLSRLVHQGWIDIRGKDQRTEAKLTDAGLKAMRPLV